MELPQLCWLFRWKTCNDQSTTEFKLFVPQLQGLFSIVLMALVDTDYHFIYVDMGDFGSNGDSGIFRNCPLGKNLIEANLDLPSPKWLPGWPVGGALPHCLAGDKAIPLQVDLMRPFPRGKKEKQLPYNKIFNYQLSRARQIVENAFGTLVQWWRVFDRRISVDDHNVI